MKPDAKSFLRLGLVIVAMPTAALVWLAVRSFGSDKASIFNDLDAVPRNRVGLVLGCVPRLADGRPNRYLSARLEAAAQLFHRDKVEYLLLSGDAHRLDGGQNETAAMQQGLLSLGIPRDRIVVDELGLRTLDSIGRAKLVYGLSRFTVVSQRFHNERALFIAGGFGLSVVAYNASDPTVPGFDRMQVREPFARVLAVLDRYVFRTVPQHLGPPIQIGDTTATTSFTDRNP